MRQVRSVGLDEARLSLQDPALPLGGVGPDVRVLVAVGAQLREEREMLAGLPEASSKCTGTFRRWNAISMVATPSRTICVLLSADEARCHSAPVAKRCAISA